MVLKSLELYRFKKFAKAEFHFTPGLNIIRGLNEAGKSTLRLAITTALFGNPTSSSEAIRALTTWGKNERCELRLDYMDDTNTLCEVRKDFAGGKIFMVRGEESLRTQKSIQKQICESLGINTEELFNLCAALDVRSLANLGTQAGRKQVGKMLAGLMTGTTSGSDVVQAVRRLDDAIRNIGKGERAAAVKNPGPIRQVKDEIIQLQAKLAQTRKAAELQDKQRKEMLEIETAYKGCRQAMETSARLIETTKRFIEAQQRKDELAVQDGELEKQMNQRKELLQEVNALKREIEQSPLKGWTSEGIEALRSLCYKKESLEEKKPEPPQSSNLSLWLFVLAGAIGLTGVALLASLTSVGVGFLLGGLGILIAGWLRYTDRKKVFADYSRREQHWKAETLAVGNKINELMQSNPEVTSETVLAQWPGFHQKQIEFQTLTRQLDETGEIDENRWETVRREIRLVDDVLRDPDLQAMRLAPELFTQKKIEHENNKKKMADMEQQKHKLAAGLATLQVNQEDVVTLEESYAETQKRLAKLEHIEKIYRLAREILDQARRDTLNPARKVLEKRAGEYLTSFSHGRYDNIAVDDEDLSSKILVQETGRWENPDVLSQGTFDQFYLSLRLAMAEVLTNGKKTPLLLDEPLTAFDPIRTKTTLDMLKQLSRERQILFFTCKPEYDAAADTLILLDQ